jgi:hypothetical protein
MPHYRENTPKGARNVPHPKGKPQRQNAPGGVEHVKSKANTKSRKKKTEAQLLAEDKAKFLARSAKWNKVEADKLAKLKAKFDKDNAKWNKANIEKMAKTKKAFLAERAAFNKAEEAKLDKAMARHKAYKK